MATTMRSIEPVLTSSRGYWTVRVRTTGGEEFYLPPAYTLHQAQVAADSIRRDVAQHGGVALGDLGPLPDGVRVVRS
jgi:hypothetical protein